MRWEPAYLGALGPRGARLQQIIEVAEAEGDGTQAVTTLIEAGDALVAAGLLAEAASAFEHAVATTEGLPADAKRLAAHLAWRLAQLAEGRRAYAEAATTYERAADLFRLTGGGIDLIASLQAEGRVRARVEGNVASMRLYREALALAREIDDPRLIAEAMELVAIAAHDMNAVEDAEASFRDAARYYRAVSDEVGYVRATIGLAECELERGDHVQAIQTLGPVEDAFEVGHDPETRARAVGLIARFYLAAGDSDQAAENFQKALDLYGQIGADRRRARLMQAFARQMEGMADPQGKFSAIDMYRSALDVYIHIRDEARIGPAAYSLARCYFEVAEPLRADEAIERALDVCMRRGDMEGLEVCTDLGVRIAVAMGQGKLAIRRIEMAARVKAEAGDYEGEVRFLLGALNASLNAPDLDSGHMADTFIESLRRTGTRFLGPAEPVEIAEQLDGAERPEYAKELMALVAAVEVDAGRLSEAAHAFDQAANYAVRADLRDEAGELWDQAIAIGERIRLPMTEDWRINRREFGSA